MDSKDSKLPPVFQKSSLFQSCGDNCIFLLFWRKVHCCRTRSQQWLYRREIKTNSQESFSFQTMELGTGLNWEVRLCAEVPHPVQAVNVPHQRLLAENILPVFPFTDHNQQLDDSGQRFYKYQQGQFLVRFCHRHTRIECLYRQELSFQEWKRFTIQPYLQANMRSFSSLKVTKLLPSCH